MNDETNPVTDPVLDAVAADLDRLAARDAQCPGLEDRVYAASVGAIAVPATLRFAAASHPRASIWARPAVRIAAVLAVAAGAGLVWTLTQHAAAPIQTPIARGNTPVAAPAAADEWAIMTAVLGESDSTDLDEALIAENTLKERMDTLGTSDVLEEGAM